MTTTNPSRSHHRRTWGEDLSPFSLAYAGTGKVSCGTDAAVVDINRGAFTIDAYIASPGPGIWQHGTAKYTIASQGDGYTAGWALDVFPQFATSGFFRISAKHVTVSPTATVVCNPMTDNTWYYVRARRNAGGDYFVSFDTTEGANHSPLGATVASAAAFQHGWRSDDQRPWIGRICYLHLWNVDKGTLAAVPTQPFAIDANTVARYRHTEGAGAALGDDADGHNGTITAATWAALFPTGWTPGD